MSRLRELADTMSALGLRQFQLLVTAMQTRVLEQDELAAAVVRRLPYPLSNTAARLIWQQTELPRLLREHPEGWLLSPFGIAPLRRARRWRSAVIVSNVAPFTEEASQWFSSRERLRNSGLRELTLRSLSHADLAFFLSIGAQRSLEAIIGPLPSVLLPMSPPNPALVQEALLTIKPHALEGVPYFCIVADLYAYKGVEDAIRATISAAALGNDIHLVICGRPMNKRYMERLQSIAEKGRPNSVTFLGPQPRIVALGLMARSIATLITSRMENPNRVPVEAMAIGSPLIAVDVPISREVCGDAAAYYPVGDALTLAEVMVRFHQEPDTRAWHTAAGMAKLSHVDWLSATRVILESIQSVERSSRYATFA
jgi:glycosyltransferase involved in cell wall biosynthesis